MKPYLYVFPLLVACGTAGADDSHAPAPVEADPIAVHVQSLEQLERPRVLALEGTVRANRRAQLSPQIAGHVSQVYVERGDTVAEGDRLIGLRTTDVRLQAAAATARAEAQRSLVSGEGDTPLEVEQLAAVRQARTQYDNQRERFDRYTALHQQGALDDQSYDDAQSALEAAEATLQAARQQGQANLAQLRALSSDAALQRQNVRDSTLRAPFAGSIVSRTAEIGEYVTPQSAVVELVDTSSLRVELDVPERDSTAIRVGQHATIAFDGFEQTLEGEVRFVAAALDATDRTLTIEVVAPNPEGLIRAGHFARVELRLNGTETFIRVPNTALRERAGVSRVFVVADEHAEAVLVEEVEHGEEYTLVRGELEAGQSFIPDVPAELSDGAPVRVEG